MEVQHCPHCEQTMMVYRRNIRKNMLHCLKRLYERFGNGWAKTNSIDERKLVTSDFEKLKYWGLIVSQNNQHSITPAGVDFLYGRVPVQKYRWIYNGKLQEQPKDQPNPLIYSHEIDPELMSREIALETATTRKTFKQRELSDLFK